jgi:hypothetical protein
METLGNRIEETFQESWLFSFKPVVVSAVLNVAASFTNQIGFVFPFALVGVPFLLRKRRIAAELLFLAILLVVFIPMLPSSLYITMLLTPFVAILGVAWIGQLLHGKKHMFWLSVVVVIVIASILLPFWSSARWNETVQISGYTTVVDDQGVNDARYIGQYQDEAFAISNVDITGLRLSAISGTIFLGSGVMFVLSGDMTSEMVKENLTWAQEDFPNNLYSWFEAGNDATPDIRVLSLYQRGAYYSNLSEMRDFYSAHSRLLVTVDNNWPNNYVWVWGIYPASLPEELRSAIWHESDGSHPRFLPSYIVYESEGISMFATQLPVL